MDYHPFSIYKLVSQGVLHPQKVTGKTLVFSQEELDRYKASNRWAAWKEALREANRKPAPKLDFAWADPPFAEKGSNITDELNTLTATVVVDFWGGSFKSRGTIRPFTWEQIPLIRASLNEQYGTEIKTIRITVKSPDGCKWHIRFKPTKTKKQDASDQFLEEDF